MLQNLGVSELIDRTKPSKSHQSVLHFNLKHIFHKEEVFLTPGLPGLINRTRPLKKHLGISNFESQHNFPEEDKFQRN